MRLLFDSLKESVVFWLRNFPLLALLTATTLGPGKFLFWQILVTHSHLRRWELAVVSLSMILFQAVQESALLGVLLLKTEENSVWIAMRYGVSAGWWKFSVIHLVADLLSAIPAVLLVDNLLNSAVRHPTVFPLVWIVGLVSAITYSTLGLILPVVIVERLPLLSALKRTLILTGWDPASLLVMGYMVLLIVSKITSHFTRFHLVSSQMPSLIQLVAPELVQAQIDSLFLVLLGVMYQKITKYERLLAYLNKT